MGYLYFPHRLMVTACLCLLLPVLTYAQDQKSRHIEKVSQRNEPVEIVDLQTDSVQVDSQSFKLGSAFMGDEHWLRGLTLNVKNVSAKSIVYIRVEIEFPKIGTMEYPFVVPVTYGQIPPPASEINSLPVPKRAVIHGNSVKLRLTDTMYDFAREFLKKKDVSSIDNVKFSIQFIVFEDGTAWSNGYLLNRDSNDPRKWNVIGSSGEDVSSFSKNSYKFASLKVTGNFF